MKVETKRKEKEFPFKPDNCVEKTSKGKVVIDDKGKTVISLKPKQEFKDLV